MATKLTAERVIEGAVRLADRIGVDALTIRKLAEEIDAKPMTIYHHVPNKEAIIDGMVDAVFAEVDLPPQELDWKSAILVRSRSMRSVLAEHMWAAPLMESRTSPGPATLTHHDAVIGCFRQAGFSFDLTATAYATVDAFIYGYAMQAAALPGTDGEDVVEMVEAMPEQQMRTDLYPHLTEFTVEHVLQPGYDFARQFEAGLELILEGLERAAKARPGKR